MQLLAHWRLLMCAESVDNVAWKDFFYDKAYSYWPEKTRIPNG